MFNTFMNTVIDQVVVAKKAVIEVTSPSKEVKSILSDFVDAQAKYTREATKTSTEIFNRFSELAMDRTPYVDAVKNLSKFFPTATCATPSKKKA